jgi:hypothetical protein
MESFILGRWTEKILNAMMREAAEILDAGEGIAFISEKFLGLPYQEKTLIGDIKTTEVFVINLSAVDCFTFLDCVEAMRLSASFSEFKENLRRVRYKTGKVAFENRNHFFSDWAIFNAELVDDVTREIGGENTIKVNKTLNVKQDGMHFVPGIQPRDIAMSYIPSQHIHEDKLKTGDYVGIYSEKAGLDVSHVGIIIKNENSSLITHHSSLLLRHASSVQRKVVDEDLKKYMHVKPGLIVLRAKREGIV